MNRRPNERAPNGNGMRPAGSHRRGFSRVKQGQEGNGYGIVGWIEGRLFGNDFRDRFGFGAEALDYLRLGGFAPPRAALSGPFGASDEQVNGREVLAHNEGRPEEPIVPADGKSFGAVFTPAVEPPQTEAAWGSFGPIDEAPQRVPLAMPGSDRPAPLFPTGTIPFAPRPLPGGGSLPGAKPDRTQSPWGEPNAGAPRGMELRGLPTGSQAVARAFQAGGEARAPTLYQGPATFAASDRAYPEDGRVRLAAARTGAEARQSVRGGLVQNPAAHRWTRLSPEARRLDPQLAGTARALDAAKRLIQVRDQRLMANLGINLAPGGD